MQEMEHIEYKSLDGSFHIRTFDLEGAKLLAYVQILSDCFSWFCKRHSLTDKFVLNLNLVSENEIRQINKEHREKDKATDVLSFPMQESVREYSYDQFMSPVELGDLIICKQVCEKQALEHNIDFRSEFVHLAIHGFLHLFGYDHELSKEEDILMQSLEEQILEYFLSKKIALSY